MLLKPLFNNLCSLKARPDFISPQSNACVLSQFYCGTELKIMLTSAGICGPKKYCRGFEIQKFLPVSYNLKSLVHLLLMQKPSTNSAFIASMC